MCTLPRLGCVCSGALMQRLSGHMSLPRGRRQAQIQPLLHVHANAQEHSAEKSRGSSPETDCRSTKNDLEALLILARTRAVWVTMQEYRCRLCTGRLVYHWQLPWKKAYTVHHTLQMARVCMYVQVFVGRLVHRPSLSFQCIKTLPPFAAWCSTGFKKRSPKRIRSHWCQATRPPSQTQREGTVLSKVLITGETQSEPQIPPPSHRYSSDYFVLQTCSCRKIGCLTFSF